MNLSYQIRHAAEQKVFLSVQLKETNFSGFKTIFCEQILFSVIKQSALRGATNFVCEKEVPLKLIMKILSAERLNYDK